MAGSGRTGYVWGGALALAASEKEGATFLFGLLSYPQPTPGTGDGWGSATDYNTCAIKARAGAGPVQQCLYTISRESAMFFDVYTDDSGKEVNPRFFPPPPLPAGSLFMMSFGMTGEACGIPAYDLRAAWNGTRLVRMPALEHNSDSGVWTYDEEYVFPGSKGGRAGHVVVRGTSREYAEDNISGKPIRTNVTTKAYRWDAAQDAFEAVK